MNENEIAKEIVDAAYQVHRKLGPGREVTCLTQRRKVAKPIKIMDENEVKIMRMGDVGSFVTL